MVGALVLIAQVGALGYAQAPANPPEDAGTSDTDTPAKTGDAPDDASSDDGDKPAAADPKPAAKDAIAC